MFVQSVTKVTMLLKLPIFLLISLASAQTWNNCGTDTTDLKVTNVIFTPNPVTKGQNFTLDIYTTGVAVTGGTFSIDVYFSGIKVFSDNLDLCEETSCPISAGVGKISHSQSLPPVTPSGSYAIKATGKDLSGNSLVCADIKFDVDVVHEFDNYPHSIVTKYLVK